MKESNYTSKIYEDKVISMSYYDFHWRQIGGKLSKDPYIAEKTKIILDIIPEECTIIVDVGCSDGAITNVLSEK
jgi:hypothetical protein